MNEPSDRFCGECAASLDATSQTPPPAAQPSLPLPSSIAGGRYNLRRFLGEGGKKRVYLAHDTRLDTDVAIALIKTEGLDAQGLTRVQREAQAMGRLRDHPHIVTVLDIGQEDGQPYIVMEHMEGGALDERLSRADHHRLPVDQAMGVALHVSEALGHAHERGIIHRDLKPGNIWLSEDGAARIGDFGLAIAADRSRLTREGLMVGTPSYMPPEQAVGGEATPRSDLYALGCVLYEMVTGRPPFLGDDTVGVISQHINVAPVAPSWHNPDMPQGLEILIMRLLAKAPEERPADAASVAAELRRIRERPAAEPAAVPVTASAELRGVDWGRFVGRREEIEQLQASLEGVFSGRGSLVMLVGEPGIGKTRLAEEFGVYARLRGAQVLTGRCYEGEVALPYRPFVEAFRQYVRSRGDGELRSELGEGAPEVARLISEVRHRFPDIPQAPPLEADAERLRLFESVSAFVRNAAQANPLVLFLDDIHWADKPSLLMLRYLARAIAGERVLILTAYRDVELDRAHPLAEVIATLRREQPYRRVRVRGLREEDILALLAVLQPSGEEAPGQPALAAALHRETEGNPFFVREVLSHLVDEGKLYRQDGRWTSSVASPSELGIPEGVRDVIGRRLSRLSASCNRLLTLASTMTAGFSWEALKAVGGEPEPALLDLLDEALAAQLIKERKGDQAGSYDFTHALIRQTLYDELSTPRRVVLHRQIGEALETLYAGNMEPHLAELAHHFYQAAPGGDAGKAIDYARRAGDRAVELLAYEEAAAQYDLALQALELGGASDERQRFDLLFAFAQAYGRADLPERSLATWERAVALAERMGDAELHARAACAYAYEELRGALQGSQAAVPALERALAADQPPALRALLLARLSQALMEPGGGLGPIARRLALAREARSLAEEAGDAEALAVALLALLQAIGGPEHVGEHLALAGELLEVAQRAGHGEWTAMARLCRVTDLAQLGEMEDVEREIALMVDLGDRMREPLYGGMRPLWAAMLAVMRGRYDEAERLTMQVVPIAQRSQNLNVTGSLAAQVTEIRWAQGRMVELEPLILQQLERTPNVRAWEATLALVYLEAGDRGNARNWFERFARDDFAEIDRNFVWSIAMSSAALVARRLSDERRAALLYDALSPYAGRQIVAGNAVLCDGSMCRPLGMLAATMRRWDNAERHFERALVFDERIGAWPWLARTRYEYADMLRERGGPGDDEKAQALVNLALATFEELGMPKDVERALALKLELQGVASVGVRTSIDVVAASVQAERPSMRPHAAPDGTVTLMFSDIQDSTVVTERVGDRRWLELLHEHNTIVRREVAAHGGFEVKTAGDGFMVAFSSARRALNCAIAIQHAFAEHNERAEQPLRVRIGLHTGEAIRDADDFFGRHVILASRIAGQARGGEILVSSLLKELTASAGDVSFDEGREVELKGLSGTHRVYAVAWEQP